MGDNAEPQLVDASDESTLDIIDWSIPVGILSRAGDLSDTHKKKHIAVLNLTVRAYNALTKVGIHQIGEILGLTVKDLMSLRNMGRSSVWNIIARMHQYSHGIESTRICISPVSAGTASGYSASLTMEQADCQSLNDTECAGKALIAALIESNDPNCIYSMDWSSPLFELFFVGIKPHIYHDTPIQKLGLSVRAFNCLNKSGFQIFEGVLHLTIEQLFAIPNMGVRSVWDILKSSYKFCCSKTTPLQLNATILNSAQPPETPLAQPPNAETVIKHLLMAKDTTSIAVHEAVEAVASQYKIKEAKARHLVTSLPGFIFVGDYMLHTNEEFITCVQRSQFKTFKSLFVEVLNSSVGKRNANIVLDRYGFNGDMCVLQDLADMYELTRERVRQVIFSAIKKLMKEKSLWIFLRQPFEDTLKDCGNICRTRALADLFNLKYRDIWDGLPGEGYIEFIAETDDTVHVSRSNGDMVIYRSPISPKTVQRFSEWAKEFLANEGSPVLDDIVGQQLVACWQSFLPDSIPPVMNRTEILFLSSDIRLVDDTWILSDWKWAAPRTKVDQIQAILRENGAPMHYRTIAERYREKFGEITARQIHAGLGTKPDIFILTGQGTYGLAEWGLTKIRWIGDIIFEFLASSGKPMTEEEIRQAVWKEREASEASILLELSVIKNHLFHRFGNKWGLTQWLTDGTITDEDPQEWGRGLLQRLAGQRTDTRQINREETKLKLLLAKARASTDTL